MFRCNKTLIKTSRRVDDPFYKCLFKEIYTTLYLIGSTTYRVEVLINQESTLTILNNETINNTNRQRTIATSTSAVIINHLNKISLFLYCRTAYNCHITPSFC